MLVQVLDHAFVKKASEDIDHLISAWHDARCEVDVDADGAPRAGSVARSIARSRRSTSRPSPVRPPASAHSAHAATLSAVPSRPSSCTSSVPIHAQMPHSDLLSLSPGAIPMPDSEPQSPRSDLSSAADSGPPEYPDLPSLSMPMSVRRAYSSAASLNAQQRIQTLSTAADRLWQEADGAAWMEPRAEHHEPVAASSETRDAARALQFARPQHGMLASMLAEHEEANLRSLKGYMHLTGAESASLHSAVPTDFRDDHLPSLPEESASEAGGCDAAMMRGRSAGDGATLAQDEGGGAMWRHHSAGVPSTHVPSAKSAKTNSNHERSNASNALDVPNNRSTLAGGLPAAEADLLEEAQRLLRQDSCTPLNIGSAPAQVTAIEASPAADTSADRQPSTSATAPADPQSASVSAAATPHASEHGSSRKRTTGSLIVGALWPTESTVSGGEAMGTSAELAAAGARAVRTSATGRRSTDSDRALTAAALTHSLSPSLSNHGSAPMSIMDAYLADQAAPQPRSSACDVRPQLADGADSDAGVNSVSAPEPVLDAPAPSKAPAPSDPPAPQPSPALVSSPAPVPVRNRSGVHSSSPPELRKQIEGLTEVAAAAAAAAKSNQDGSQDPVQLHGTVSDSAAMGQVQQQEGLPPVSSQQQQLMQFGARLAVTAEQRTSIDSRRILQSLLADRGR